MTEIQLGVTLDIIQVMGQRLKHLRMEMSEVAGETGNERPPLPGGLVTFFRAVASPQLQTVVAKQA